jgi:inhibitor of KinA
MDPSGRARVRFQVASDQSLLVYFEEYAEKTSAKRTSPEKRPSKKKSERLPPPNQTTMHGHEQVRRLLRLLELEPIAAVRNLHPAYGSVLIKFDALKLRHDELEGILRGHIERMERMALPESRLVEIPACYSAEFGVDLNDVAELHAMTPDQLIELHASTIYKVYFLGFVPGFAYLGDLPQALVTPRMATPRRSVPAGSVGIAGTQTGVYPISTPGGWRLLARTPVPMFRPDAAAMSLLSIGDRVRFVPISRAQFAKLENA